MIHHATIAKAAKIGVILGEDPDTERVMAHWAERNKRAYAANSAGAPALVEDMKTFKMIVLEYPKWRVAQPYVKNDNYVYEIFIGKQVIGEGARLEDAFNDAVETIAKGARPIEDDDGDGPDRPDDTEDGNETPSQEDSGLIKTKYKDKYRAHNGSCGDDLSVKLRDFLHGDDEGLNRKKLETFAKKNEVWDDKYKHLGPGQLRMTIGNRLRAKVRKNYVVQWA